VVVLVPLRGLAFAGARTVFAATREVVLEGARTIRREEERDGPWVEVMAPGARVGRFVPAFGVATRWLPLLADAPVVAEWPARFAGALADLTVVDAAARFAGALADLTVVAAASRFAGAFADLTVVAAAARFAGAVTVLTVVDAATRFAGAFTVLTVIDAVARFAGAFTVLAAAARVARFAGAFAVLAAAARVALFAGARTVFPAVAAFEREATDFGRPAVVLLLEVLEPLDFWVSFADFIPSSLIARHLAA
jgi:hypothetical protein